MKKLLIGLLVVTGISSMGCRHLAHRHRVHRRHIGAAVVGAAVVGAAVHHAAHHRHHETVVVRRRPRARVVYVDEGCGY